MLAQETKVVPEFTSDVNELLRSEAFNGLKSLPKRGAEIGGFLIAASAEDSTLLATAVEFVSIEHLYGPSYRPSPADLQHLEQRAQLIREKPDQKLLAFFRSCTREDLLPQPEDLAIVRKVLPEANFIVLVKPFQNGHCTVRVFNAEQDELLSESELRMSLAAVVDPHIEQPRFEQTDLERPKIERPEIEPEPSFAPPPVLRYQPLLETLAPTPAKEQKPWLRYAAIATASIVLLGVASLLIRSYVASPHPQTRTGSASDFGLRVENSGSNFRVTWNRNQTALRNARATLIIDDGHTPRTLPIDQAQLASGSLVYVTDAADLTFHLQANGNNGLQSETVRVVVAKSTSAPQPSKATGAAHPEQSITPVVRSWPALALRPGVYRPAVPLHRITPSLHPSSVPKPATVQIAVKIDTKGHVVEAHEVDPIPAPESLAAPALDASQQWVFEPARKYGRNVASDYKIVYWFRPSSSTPRPVSVPSPQ